MKKTERINLRADKALYESRAAELGVSLTTFLEAAADKLVRDRRVKRLHRR